MNGNIRRRLDRLQTEATETAAAADAGPATYPSRWLGILDVLAPRLSGERAKAATECATLLRDALAAGLVGAQVCYWCGIKLDALAWHVHWPDDPRCDPNFQPVTVADIEALRERLQIDYWRRPVIPKRG